MAVRRASIQDLPLLVRVSREVQALHRAARPDFYRDPSDAELEGSLRQQLGREDTVVLVADCREEVVGFLILRLQVQAAHVFAEGQRRAHVEQLGVRQDARRSGHGRLLMQAAEAQAREWSVDGVILDVQSLNQEALRFYEALGYQPYSARVFRRL